MRALLEGNVWKDRDGAVPRCHSFMLRCSLLPSLTACHGFHGNYPLMNSSCLLKHSEQEETTNTKYIYGFHISIINNNNDTNGEVHSQDRCCPFCGDGNQYAPASLSHAVQLPFKSSSKSLVHSRNLSPLPRHSTSRAFVTCPTCRVL